jgi:hypothetical protein
VALAKETFVADSTETALLREIDEDLRADRYQRLWKQYGGWVIAGCVALVIGVAGAEAWKRYERGVLEEAGLRFAEALRLAATDRTAAEQAFGALAADGPDGYRLLAALQAGALAASAGDSDRTASAYAMVARSEDPLYRDLAVILQVMAETSEPAAASAETMAKLAGLTGDDRPLRYLARELTAHLARRSGDGERARELLQGLADDPLAPNGVRARARDVLAADASS